MDTKSFKNIMSKWGFNEKLVREQNPWDQDFISLKVTKFLNSYVTEFPNKGNITILSSPKLSQYLISNIIFQLYIQNKIFNQIFHLDVPTYIVDQFHGGLQGDQQEQQIKVKKGLKESDLVVFEEIALNKWTDNQQLRLYGLVNQRYQYKKPCIFTSSENQESTEEALKDALYYRISENCTYVDLNDLD